MDFNSIVKIALNEEMTAGGSGSVFGPGVTSTATDVSGDNYAPGDGRNVVGSVFAGTLTRGGMLGAKKKRKKKSKKRSS